MTRHAMGACLCGQVRCGAPAEPSSVMILQLPQCQKQSGGALSLLAVFPRAQSHSRATSPALKAEAEAARPCCAAFAVGADRRSIVTAQMRSRRRSAIKARRSTTSAIVAARASSGGQQAAIGAAARTPPARIADSVWMAAPGRRAVGRSSKIRTYDPHVPNVVLYQAELYSEERGLIVRDRVPPATRQNRPRNMAGVLGFEPRDGGTKNRCLTTWRHPKRGKRLLRAPAADATAARRRNTRAAECPLAKSGGLA